MKTTSSCLLKRWCVGTTPHLQGAVLGQGPLDVVVTLGPQLDHVPAGGLGGSRHASSLQIITYNTSLEDEMITNDYVNEIKHI